MEFVEYFDIKNKVQESLYKICKDLAPIRRFQLAAAIVNSRTGDLISYGFAHKKTHPFQARFQEDPRAIYWHAENHAIFNALKLRADLTKCDLIVMRTNAVEDSSLRLAKPCSGCEECLIFHGINKVFYSNSRG